MLNKMTVQNRFFIFLFILIPFILTSTACTKKRPVKFDQGKGSENLKKVSQYDKQTYKLRVIKNKFEGQVSKAAIVNYDIDLKKDAYDKKEYESIKDLNNFPQVEIKKNAPHFGNDIPFWGKLDRVGQPDLYSIQTELTEKYLIYYKVGLKKNLPYQEKLVAKPIPDKVGA